MSLPNTYIIGVQKAGTTSLHYWLSQHPDIYGPNEYKDVDYFANPEIADMAKERLVKDFVHHNGESIVFQSHVNYIFYAKALDRIKTLTPEAKLIVVLRNPIDRAISAFRYFRKMGQEPRPAEKALLYKPKEKMSYSKQNNDFTYLEHGMYGQQLEKVYEIFDQEKVLILQFKELKNKPNELIQKVFKFLNIEETFIPNFQKKNQTGKVRFKWLQKKLTKTNRLRQLVIKYLFDWWLTSKKRQYLRKQLIEINTRKMEKHKIPKSVRQELGNVFKTDQQRLKQILNNVAI